MIYGMKKLMQILCLTLVFTCAIGVAVCGAAKRVVAVMPLTVSSGDGHAADFVSMMTTQLTGALLDSGSYTVVERSRLNHALQEIGFQLGGLVDPNKSIQLGKMLGVQYSIIGDVVSAKVSNNDQKMLLGILLGAEASDVNSMKKYESSLILDLKFVNNETGEIVLATEIDGKGGNATANEAIRDACKDVTEKFLKQIAQKNPFSANVIYVEGREIYIDKGADVGLRAGDILTIVKEGMPIKNMEGAIIAVKTSVMGKLRIESVEPNYAIGHIGRNKFATNRTRHGRKTQRLLTVDS